MNNCVSSVYIHIPFCRKICSYCDFCKFYYNAQMVNNYLQALQKEIAQNYKHEQIKTLYIGGGTPSCLDTKELQQLLDMLTIFPLQQDYEYTIECNIDDINENFLKLIRQYPINRLSIGVQSFNPQKGLILNRYANYDDVYQKIQLCHAYGFHNINIDLIYAVPGETIAILKQDLALILQLPITHISTYSLMIMKNTILYNQNYEPIDEILDAQMYELITDTLTQKGYIHYEVSNFAQKGYESKHNLQYWHNCEYYGFGLGASGYLNNIRYTNTRSFNDYIQGKYLFEEEKLTLQDEMEYEIILGLRKLKGINVALFQEKFQQDIFTVYKLEPLLAQKQLIYQNGYLYINPQYLYIMNEILLAII